MEAEAQLKRGGFSVYWDDFPFELFAHDRLNVTSGEWKATYYASDKCWFRSKKDVLDSMKHNSLCWDGDVFEIIVMET